jgi:hypothetical protein
MQTGFPSNGHDFQGKQTGSLLFYGVRLPQEEGSSSVDELPTLGINSDMRCPMQTEKTLTVDSKSSESNGFGDGIDGNTAEYWEHLFNLDSGYRPLQGAQSYHPECSQLKIPSDVWHRNS